MLAINQSQSNNNKKQSALELLLSLRTLSEDGEVPNSPPSYIIDEENINNNNNNNQSIKSISPYMKPQQHVGQTTPVTSSPPSLSSVNPTPLTTPPSIKSSPHSINFITKSPSPPHSPPSFSEVPTVKSSPLENSPPLTPPFNTANALTSSLDASPLSLPVAPRPCKYPLCLLCQRGPPLIVLKCPTWSTIMRVVFYSLSKSMPDRLYYNLRTDVYSWMCDHWDYLCQPSKDKSHNWRKQVQDMLSHSKNLFESGTDHFKQNGFWRLKPQMDIDPWTIKKPQRDKSKISTSSTTSPTKNKHSSDENGQSSKKLRLSYSDVDECPEEMDADITDYLIENDNDVRLEIESVNREINVMLQQIKALNTSLQWQQQQTSCRSSAMMIPEKFDLRSSTSSMSSYGQELSMGVIRRNSINGNIKQEGAAFLLPHLRPMESICDAKYQLSHIVG
ncbi:hypothetical protein SAMD00019534_102010, partial [Acytostelium subglobosum LB1]|uniref:hypothetical protein n=1 Tax=Acytostelium subglobosum LB1 TaxID=1410327 RepID=UPI000644E46F